MVLGSLDPLLLAPDWAVCACKSAGWACALMHVCVQSRVRTGPSELLGRQGGPVQAGTGALTWTPGLPGTGKPVRPRAPQRRS